VPRTRKAKQDAQGAQDLATQATAPESASQAPGAPRAGRKRGQNEGSIFKREDGRWCGVANLGWEGGKRRRKYFYGDTRKEVAELLTGALREIQRGAPLARDERLTVEQYLTRWLKDVVQPSVRQRTVASYRQQMETHLIPDLGKTPLAKLLPQHLQAYMNRKLAAGLSPRTVQYQRAILRRSLNQALRWGLVPRNIATLVDAPRVIRQEVQPLSPVDARRLLVQVQKDRLAALYSVALAVGLRQGEALGLHWQDVDLDNDTLRVRTALQRVKLPGEQKSRLHFVEPKSEQSRRTIPLPGVAVAALKRHKDAQEMERAVAGTRWQEHGLVFTSSIGTPAEPRNVVTSFKQHLKEAGLPDQRFHDLRHTCASLLLAQGVHPRVVMETLGHSQIQLTMNTYSHVMPVMQREAASQMNTLLSATDGPENATSPPVAVSVAVN